VRTSGAGGNREFLQIFTLREVTSQSATVESMESPVSSRSKASSAPAGVSIAQRLPFLAYERPEANADLFCGSFSLNPFAYLHASKEGVFEEGGEELSVKGARIKTARYQTRIDAPSLRTTITVWISAEVPGRLVKCIRVIEGTASLKEEYAAIDYRLEKAAPEESARLRAGRRPIDIEEPAARFILEEFRFFSDYETASSKLEALQDSFARAMNESTDKNWNAASEANAAFQSSATDLKNHLAKDLLRVRSLLEPKELSKIESILNELSTFSRLFSRANEPFELVSALAANLPVVHDVAESALNKITGFIMDCQASLNRIRQEQTKLSAVKIKHAAR
jgi:hypothetical protein